jgi:hypothetical protein
MDLGRPCEIRVRRWIDPMLGTPHKWIALVAGLSIAGMACAQDVPRRVLTFSGTVSEAECADLPMSSFVIGPSGDRYKSGDRLEIRCVPWQAGHFANLSLTFIVVGQVLPSPPGGARVYTFRWSKAIDRPVDRMGGQFSMDPKRCERLASLFASKISTTASLTSPKGEKPPVWSAGCYPDDLWGTSMEFRLATNFQDGT